METWLLLLGISGAVMLVALMYCVCVLGSPPHNEHEWPENYGLKLISPEQEEDLMLQGVFGEQLELKGNGDE